MWSVSTESRVSRSGSQTTRSASEPTAIVPLRGQRPKSRAGPGRGQLDEPLRVDPSRRARPPSHSSIIRVSMPGAPFGIFEKSSRPARLVGERERAVVGRDHLQVAAREAAPERLLVGRLPQRRRHHVLRPLEAGAVVVRDREEQVLRAGLGEDGLAAVAGRRHVRERRRAGEVDDVERRPRHRGHRDRAGGGLGLRLRRARERVVARRRLAARERPLHQDVDDARRSRRGRG